MKRILCVLLSVCMLVAMTACGQDVPADTSEPVSETEVHQVPLETTDAIDPEVSDESKESEELSGDALYKDVLDAVTVQVLSRDVVPFEEAALENTALAIEDVSSDVKEATVFTIAFLTNLSAHPDMEYEYKIKNVSSLVSLYDHEQNEYPSSVHMTSFIGDNEDYRMCRVIAAGDVAAEDLMIEICYDWNHDIKRMIQLPSEIVGFDDAKTRFVADNQPDLKEKITEINGRLFFIEMDGSFDRGSKSESGKEYVTYGHVYHVVPLVGNVLVGLSESDFVTECVKDIPGTSVKVSFDMSATHPENLDIVFEAEHQMLGESNNGTYTEAEYDAAEDAINEAYANTYFKTLDGSFAMRSAGTFGTY